MKKKNLNNNHKIPVIGLGTWNADKTKVADAVEFAVNKVGYRHIDCASIYGNEKEIGKAFENIKQAGHVKREDLFITSKLWNTDHRADNVVKACKKSLSDLKLDYLDLYLMHWAIAFVPGGDSEPLDSEGFVIRDNVSIRETWEAVEQLVKIGLVKSIGVSNFSVQSIIDLLTYAQIKPVVNQIELHPYNTQTGLLNFMSHEEIVPIAYSPLGTPGGLKPQDPVLLKDKQIINLAKKYNKTPAQIVLNWGVSRDCVVIPKSIDKVRLKQNFESFDFKLTEKEILEITNLNRNYRFVDPINWWNISYFS